MIEFDSEAFDRVMEKSLDHLEHHGVKGMKWGSRKGSHTSTDAKRTQAILDKSKSNTTKVKSLTNHELTQFNKRMEMEKKFHQLKPEDNKVKKGHAFVKGAIVGGLAAGALANRAFEFSKSPTGKMIKDGLTKKSTGKHFAK